MSESTPGIRQQGEGVPFQQEVHEPIVAAFDFDGTLTARDSMLPFLRFFAGSGKFAGHLLQLTPAMVRYAFGMTNRQMAKEAVLIRFLGGEAESKVTEMGTIFAQQRLPYLVRRKAMDRLRWHQRQGHYCVLVSASVDAYLQPWGQAMGFDAVICSQLERDGDAHITGRLAGENCWGAEKVRRLRQLVGQPAALYAYGDSRGDREMLEIADHAYYRYMPDAGEP